MVDELEEALSKGDYKKSLMLVMGKKNVLHQISNLRKVAERFGRLEPVEIMIKLSEKLPLVDRIKAYCIIGRTAGALGLEKEADKYFQRARESIEGVPSTTIQGELLSYLAWSMGKDRRYKDAFETFREAYEVLLRTWGFSHSIIGSMIELGQRIGEIADEVPNELALEYYLLASKVFSIIGFNLQAQDFSNRAELVMETLKRGSNKILELFDQGDVELALSMTRFLKPQQKVVSLLRMFLWAVVHEQENIANRTFEEALNLLGVGKFKPPQETIIRFAYGALRLGRGREALILAGFIENDTIAAEIVGKVLLKIGNPDVLEVIVENVKNEDLRNRIKELIKEIKS